MSDAPRELLVVVEPADFDAALQRLRAVAVVTQVVPSRLVLIVDDPAAADRASQVPGVVSVHRGSPPDLADLSSVQRSFLAAWGSRALPKARPGDGEAWDAPGFLPPDDPAGDE